VKKTQIIQDPNETDLKQIVDMLLNSFPTEEQFDSKMKDNELKEKIKMNTWKMICKEADLRLLHKSV